MSNLSNNVQYIKGVGPKKASYLKKLGINAILDLLYYFPNDYEDRSKFSTIREATVGEKASLEVEIVGNPKISRPRRNMSILNIPFKDSSGYGFLTWFNQEYLKDRFVIGESYRVNGKINKIGMELQVMNPVFEKVDKENKIGKIVPIYGLTKGINNNEIAKIIESCLKEYLPLVEESMPLTYMEKFRLIDIQAALENIHFPKDTRFLHEARRRLIFEELFLLQLGLFMIKNRTYKDNNGIQFPICTDLEDLLSSLPFTLTNAQKNVLNEIQNDMSSIKQMNRLVQGDVGSGKTIIAAASMFRAVKSGYQAAMMAPTEILATQHFESLTELFRKFDIRCELLVGSLSQKTKQKIVSDLKEGKIDVLIGTHALIQDTVEFSNLGFVVTDEQHRFGVKQRAIISQKGNNPDILVMTATPIPRTLALILYGDLDISIIDELPPGRKEIETYAVPAGMVDRINVFIEKQILEGRQAYVVSPLIEESETMDLKSVEELYDNYKNNIFKDYNVGLLHGKMRPSEKDAIMDDFKNQRIDILISTTVIEVGVNVPNANIMVVYDAERFGLAQLHQLRGRVGRGEYQSYCILINNSKSQIARARMRIMQSSTDGFIISEKDLELRGPGEFFGTKQHGLPDLKIANLFRDINILKVAQKEAQDIIETNPLLEGEEFKIMRLRIKDLFKEVDIIN
ncbi:MAG: ATP-dependent DNA helicase RecG [Tissierellaceae bacterium]|nr:ATP-dependent DNA helicase RecG [Tissierellaceae bacterium]